MLEDLKEALSAFTKVGVVSQAKMLFGVLGYHSERSIDIGCLNQFMAMLEEEKPMTKRQRDLFTSWRSADIIFQVTGEEIVSHLNLFQEFDKGRTKSFLFVASDLEPRAYSRSELAEMARAVNRGFPMPAVILFQHGSNLTLAVTHRRPHKLDSSRDVLERVTLVKDIRPDNPHRAHLEILNELALSRLIYEGVHDFDGLHTAWERVLDIEQLNRRFYHELFVWFQRAVAECHFPDDCADKGSTERNVIRLITRLLFIWFMKEKGLIPSKLFENAFAQSILKYHTPDRTDYYCAVLQNLFFATLNSEINEREFSKPANERRHEFSKRANERRHDFTKYRYRKMLTNPDQFVDLLKSVPFVNGGLFDCLDDIFTSGISGRRVDAFTDNIGTQEGDLNVPAWLFLDDQKGLFPLFRRYKFTVEENTPLDCEIALDPELLGRVFENLLAAYNPETRATVRKATGSYYTPRQVVDYMVQESLADALARKSRPTVDGDYDNCWRERLGHLLDHSDAMADADELFEAGEKRTIVAAIADIKVLDPAVGSGAFPMGILQKLTLALRRLDPENRLWEELQKARAKARAGDAFDAPDQDRRDDALREVSDTFEKYRQSDFGRKLYLIQNSIYGVDIQPVACQIAKLRFFISLAIEQDVDPDIENLGIKPLPNLETRFVAADSLLGLEHSTQRELGQTDTVRKLEQDLTANRELHFHAWDWRKKLWLREEDTKLRTQLANELRRSGLPVGAAEKIVQWDPFDQNTTADWFDPNYMFGVYGGFDVVIGNPPYVESRNNLISAQQKQAYGNQVRMDWNDTLPHGSDLLIYFLTRGARFLHTKGVGCFITQNAWLSTNYGLAFQSFSRNRFSFDRIVDTSAKFFSDVKGPNINAVIASFNLTNNVSIEYAIADANMNLTSSKVVKPREGIKWGRLFSMPTFFEHLLNAISADQDLSSMRRIRFGQGINVSKSKLNGPGHL